MKPVPYYQEEGITIYCDDNRNVLPYIEPVNLVLTDPPYGINKAEWDNIECVDGVLLSKVMKDDAIMFCFTGISTLFKMMEKLKLINSLFALGGLTLI